MFDKDILKGLKIGLGIFLFFGVLFGLVWAVGFHSPNEILAGTFVGDYIFQGNVQFDNDVQFENNVRFSNISYCNSSNEGSIRYNSGVFEGCDGLAWNNLANEAYDGDLSTFLLFHFDNNYDDSSFRHYVSTSSGSPTVSSTGKFGNTLYLNGASYVSVADSTDWTFAGDFTIDYWVKTTASSDATYDAMFSIGEFNVAQKLVIFQRYSTNVPTIYVNGVAEVITGTTAINNNAWHHIALVRSSGVIKLYVDGVQEGSSYSYSGTLDGDFARLGYTSSAGSTYFTGYIDELRVSNGVARWIVNFTPPTSPYN